MGHYFAHWHQQPRVGAYRRHRSVDRSAGPEREQPDSSGHPWRTWRRFHSVGAFVSRALGEPLHRRRMGSTGSREDLRVERQRPHRRNQDGPQMEQDTLDVANYLRNRFQRKKIFVIGHSCGSLLSLWLAHEHPDLIYAYVGVGQVVKPKQNDEVAYRNALQEARSTHNQQAVRQLESNAPP